MKDPTFGLFLVALAIAWHGVCMLDTAQTQNEGTAKLSADIKSGLNNQASSINDLRREVSHISNAMDRANTFAIIHGGAQ